MTRKKKDSDRFFNAAGVLIARLLFALFALFLLRQGGEIACFFAGLLIGSILAAWD